MVALAYEVPNLAGYIACDVSNIEPGLAFEKEVIYLGQFVQADGVQFRVEKSDLQHWAGQITTFNNLGIKIPLPIGHTQDPEASRGEVIGARVGTNDNNIDALFVRVAFRDAEAAQLAKSSDVSIYVPTEFRDGLGNVYKRPITHVAITDYPVVPGLSKFTPIVASLDTGKHKMSIKKLAKQLELEFDEEKDDEEQILSKIVSHVDSLKASKKKAEDAVQAATTKIEKIEASLNAKKDPADPESKKEPMALSAAFTDMYAENRRHKIDALVNAGKITPAAAEDLTKKYADTKALALSLSNDPSGKSDGFDAILEVLNKNDPVMSFSQNGRSPAQLGNSNGIGGNKESPLVAAARRRQERAAAK